MDAMTPTSSTGGPSEVSAPSEAPAPDVAASDGGPYWYGAEKTALLGRLRRIEGQIRGLHRMVDEDAYCIDILTQISAATRALQAVAVGLLEGHLAHCVVQAARDGDPAAKVKEASEAIARLVRS
jgi:CsoR family transcriptional regulator, copper-sensing transcriptional repressor